MEMICSNCKLWDYNKFIEDKYGMGVGICRGDNSVKFCSHQCILCIPGELMIVEINPDFAEAVAANDGYCPCAIERTEDTLCMCKEFREQAEGECHCGRYKKVKV